MNMAGPSHHDEIIVPKAVLLMAGALVLSVLLLVLAVRTGVVDPAPSAGELRVERGVAPAAERDLRFADGPAGEVIVTDAGTGATVAVLGQLDSGFVRGVMRSLARERRANGVGAETAFRLTAWQNGELTLTDPATGRRVELTGFGSTNRAAFARMLDGKGR